MLNAVAVHERNADELDAAFVTLLLNEVLGAYSDTSLVDCERRKLDLPQRPWIELASEPEKLLPVLQPERHRVHCQLFLPHHGFERLGVIVNIHGASLLRGS